MIAEIGHFALILAFLTALVQGSLPTIGAHRGNAAWMALARPASVAQLLFITIAFGALMYGFVVSDFSIDNVARNSNSAMPMLYKISSTWGSHEGSLVLWVLILSLFGAVVALSGGNLPPSLRTRVLGVQAWIAIGFLAFSLFTSNPFLRLDPAPLRIRFQRPLRFRTGTGDPRSGGARTSPHPPGSRRSGSGLRRPLLLLPRHWQTPSTDCHRWSQRHLYPSRRHRLLPRGRPRRSHDPCQ